MYNNYMQALILPGYSYNNKTWVDDLSSNLRFKGDIRPFYWMHWSDESVGFDPYEKAELIVKHLKGESANIIAKSAGILVASLVYKKIPNQINKVVFCGLPIADMKEEGVSLVKFVISDLKTRFLGIQNTNDPHGTFEQVKDLGNFISKDSDTHEYPYFDDINNFLNK